MTSNGSYNLTVDGELRYLVQWFGEWSDFQREDFVPYLVSYLSCQSGGGTYVNGLISAMAQINPGQDKPMSLFQCRVKLFNEWSGKWPEEFKSTLLERLDQIDSTFGSRIRAEMEDSRKAVNGAVDETTDASDVKTEESESYPANASIDATSVTATAILIADED